MSILAAAPALLFGLGCLFALAVLAASGRRAIAAWGELARSLEGCGEVRAVRIAISETGGHPARPQLRLVECGLRFPAAARCRALRAAA